ncbi:MAG: tyrosine-protein phosphatase [Verrucomicrobia bacterium]|nr:tyrosine-protein phosphatase [Verrucomicrobiota bacterium]
MHPSTLPQGEDEVLPALEQFNSHGRFSKSPMIDTAAKRSGDQCRTNTRWGRTRSFALGVALFGGIIINSDASDGTAPPAFSQTPATPKRARAVKLNRPGLTNFHQVSTNLFRCAQPTARGMRELEAMGIKTVINLRAFHSDKDELKGTSLKCERISFNTWHPEDEDVIRFLRIVADTNRGPFVVHCQHGSDRTGTMIAIYRIAFEGWSKDEAIREMTSRDFGFHKVWQNLVRYLRELDLEKLRRKAGIQSVPTKE